MRVFVVSKKIMKIYSLAALALIGIYIGGTNIGEAVFTGESSKELPIYCVETQEKKIALTFDAAWGNEDTDDLIKVLNENSAKASFFVVGGWADRFPEDVKKFHEAGHEILNHSDTHAHMANLTAEQITAELNDCENKIKNITGAEHKLFRAPYGEYNDSVIKTAKENGYMTIQWDVEPSATVGNGHYIRGLAWFFEQNIKCIISE